MKEPEHKDMFDVILSVGDVVITPYSNMLSVGRIERMTKKMIQLKGINHRYIRRLVYPIDCMKIDSEAATMFILRTER